MIVFITELRKTRIQVDAPSYQLYNILSQVALAEPDMWLSCSLPAPVGIAHFFCLFLSFYSGLLFMIQGADDAEDTLNILYDKEGKSQPASENGDPSQIGL